MKVIVCEEKSLYRQVLCTEKTSSRRILYLLEYVDKISVIKVLKLKAILNSKTVFSKIQIISEKQIIRDLKAYLHSKVMFSKLNISQVRPGARSYLFLSNSARQDQDNETI